MTNANISLDYHYSLLPTNCIELRNWSTSLLSIAAQHPYPIRAIDETFRHSPSPFNSSVLRDWFYGSIIKTSQKTYSLSEMAEIFREDLDPDFINTRKVLCVGDGPFPCSEISDYLVGRGCELVDGKTPFSTLILGRSGWNLESMRDVISNGHPDNVLSQEGFLTLSACSKPSRTAPPSILQLIHAGHPASSILRAEAKSPVFLRPRRARSERTDFEVELGAVACVGSSPFACDDMKDFSTKRGYTVVAPEATAGVLVIGRDGWSGGELNRIIDAHRERNLRIYSQEMFVIREMDNGKDPFCGESQVLKEFAVGHPGLQFVAEGWLGWVHAWVHRDRNWKPGKDTYSSRNEESPLHVMGYCVGKTSKLSQMTRQRILESAFKGDIPVVSDNEYMSSWGKPESCKRLKKIADHIAQLCREKAGRSDAYTFYEAINDWQMDLEWMRKDFYKGRCQFDWPNAQA